MSAGPVVDTCPNCGAPLRVALDGTCHWCHAVIHTAPPPQQHAGVLPSSSAARLLPAEVDDEGVAPFIALIISSFRLLGTQALIMEVTSRPPGLLPAIRALCTAVGAAGVRVWDAGLLSGEFDDSIKHYTPEEIWLCDLAVDVIAGLGGVEGLPRRIRVLVVENVQCLDDQVTKRTWQQDLKAARDGIPAFAELRATTPHHKPNPEP
jgi:hypothetical protein